ncbi:M16 family metallopeptidase [Streptomyces sp. NBC_00576]|uniref:M16 family metallopeptidase n=1 Tax=Streptomyces sp. NBC_00576 TaxID=2903665 RepID=UPI002E80F0CD|nr:pitrilysin family protein [Streptomyces sp. NBC_00576]WUB76595.1 insulinase family protein [Streptomyces sp. NBC_00576]
MTLSARVPRPVSGPAAAWKFPAVHRTTLRSGLRVVRYDLPGQLLAAAVLVLDVPPEIEPEDREGIATIMSRTLDEGTARRDNSVFAAEMDRLGASYSASVNTAGIQLNLEAPARFFGPALGLLAEAATEPTFPAAEVERHVQQRLGELEQERAVASSLAGTERLAACFEQDSRYSRPVGGRAESVRRIDRDAVELFYLRWVAAERATLVLAGDFQGVDVERAAETAFGAWGAKAAAALVSDQHPRAAAASLVIADRPGAVQSQLAFGLKAPDRRTPHWADLMVAARVLGGGVNSRLSASLREDKGYTYGIHAGFTSLRRGGLFSIDTPVQTDATAPAVDEVLAVTEKFCVDGPTRAECAEAVDFMTGIHPLRHETARAIAASAAMQAAFNLGDSYLDDLQDALRAVTPASAAAAFRDHVDPADLTLVVAGDAAVISSALSSTTGREAKVISV